MANGKFIYTPRITKAISLDEAHYLSLASVDAFNVGVKDFNVSFLMWMDSTIQTGNDDKLVIGKGSYYLANKRGWWIGVDARAGALLINFNDGNAAAVSMTSHIAANLTNRRPLYDDGVLYDTGRVYGGDFNPGQWVWVYCAFDRSGYLTVWVNGVLMATYLITSRPGSWSNSDPLWIGNWGADAGKYFKGYLGRVRLDIDRLFDTGWIAQEWAKVKYGYPEAPAPDYLQEWRFGDSLIGTGDTQYTLIYNGGGSPAYVVGYSTAEAPITYPFAKNFAWNYAPGWLALDDQQRTQGGAAFASDGGLKQKFNIHFSRASLDQWIAIQAAAMGKYNLQFYKYADRERTAWVRFASPPEAEEVAAFRDGQPTWDIDCELEEV